MKQNFHKKVGCCKREKRKILKHFREKCRTLYKVVFKNKEKKKVREKKKGKKTKLTFPRRDF